MSVRVTVTQSTNLQALAEAAAQRATEIVMGELSAAFDQSFTAQAWSWPRQTRRSNGDLVGSPRNIIDQAGAGGLRSTGSWQMVGPYQAIFKWSSEYATGVHEGYVTKRESGPGVIVPARPWTRAVLGQETVSGIQTYNAADRLRNVWLAQLRR